MKKATLVFLGAVFVLTSLGVGSTAQATVLSQGVRSDEVEAIQEVLKEDPTIYPEGYTTGYYGSLTAKAVKNLQRKFNIPQTGNIDEETSEILFPNLRVRVLSPNGGEVWNRNNIQTIKWIVAVPVTNETAEETKYFRPKASIDLFRKVRITGDCTGEACATVAIERSVFVKHIATVNLFNMAYSWKIPNSIKNDDDYVIRVSTGRRIVPFLLEKNDTELQEAWRVKKGIYWDESDGTFTVTGAIPEARLPSLEEVIKILESMIRELDRAVQLLKKI